LSLAAGCTPAVKGLGAQGEHELDSGPDLAQVEKVTVKADGLDVSIRSDGLHSIISELKGNTDSCQQ
jgi:hypothetical protein